MVSSAVTAPRSCPRCGNQNNIPLVREGDRQRFQCGRCSDNFWAVPLPETRTAAAPAPGGTAFVPIAIPDRTAGPAGTCGKCKKPYWRLGKKYDEHVASCDGKPYVEPRKRKKPVLDVTPTPTQVYEMSLASLRARREALEAEIRGLDVSIAELEEKVKDAGGPSPAPFAAGGRVTP